MPAVKKVALASRVNYPVTVKYGGKDFILPPKKKTKREFEKAKLGSVNPKEVTVLN